MFFGHLKGVVLFWKMSHLAPIWDIAPDLGSGAARRGGSSPSTRTTGSADRIGTGFPLHA